jgi:hypothetical protein
MDKKPLDAYYRLMSSNTPEINTPEKDLDAVEMTEKEVFSFIFESFRYSQGSSKLQREIFTWFWYKYPNYTISRDVQKGAKQKVIDTTLQMVHTKRHRVVSLTEIQNTADTEIKNFINSKPKKPANIDMGMLLHDIVRQMLKRDIKFSQAREQYSYVAGIIDQSVKSNSRHFQLLLDDIRQYILDHPELLK